ncbi:S41 family peptidase [bacterium]|nr:S41 family peptidase [bacterium]
MSLGTLLKSLSWSALGALLVVQLGVLAGGYALGVRGMFIHHVPEIALHAVGAEKPPEGVDFTAVWKAWRLIDERFVPAAFSSSSPDRATTTEGKTNERIWGMTQGLASSLGDPYTFFLPPQENTAFSQELQGSFEGVGMEIAVRDSVLTVVSPLKGTPAKKAGIKAGDKIFKIDALETKGMDVGTAVKHIRGPKGTKVKLLMLRDGWQSTKEVSVVRDVINVPIVTTKKQDGVFIITVSSFTKNSPELFKNALREFTKAGTTKLILDLRSNPGGYLEAAVDMASWFLPEGKMVVTEDYAGHKENVVHRSRGYNIFNTNLNMIILVDKGSASASEILAGALHDYKIARLVGTQTFGKGSVQELVDITSDTALKVTVARWIMPDGYNITGEGIAPDVEVKPSDEDLKKANDVQLKKAIELLNSQK